MSEEGGAADDEVPIGGASMWVRLVGMFVHLLVLENARAHNETKYGWEL